MKKLMVFTLNILFYINCFCQTSTEFLDKAFLKYINEDYEGAILIYDEAIKLYPNNSELYIRRSFAREEIKDYQGALEDINKADKISNLNNYSSKGRLKMKLEDYRGAIAEFDKSIIDFPKGSDYEYRANAKFELRDYQGAINDYSKAIELSKDDPKSLLYINRGLAKINLKQINSGCLDLSKAGELGDKDAYDLIKKLCN